MKFFFKREWVSWWLEVRTQTLLPFRSGTTRSWHDLAKSKKRRLNDSFDMSSGFRICTLNPTLAINRVL